MEPESTAAVARALEQAERQLSAALWLSAGMIWACAMIALLAAGWRRCALSAGLAYALTLCFVPVGFARALGPCAAAAALVGLARPGNRTGRTPPP
jgi:hypothetical protein